MIETIALWIGYIIMLMSVLCLMIFLTWLLYYVYDYWVKQILGWENIQIRKDIFYFMKHKDEIKELLKERDDKQ